MQHRVLAALLVIAALVVLLPVWVMAQSVSAEIQAALDNGDIDEAISLLQAAIQSDPGYHINYYELGIIYFDQGQFAKAREQLELAQEKKGKHYESLYYLGRSLLELGEVDAADELLQKGLKKSKSLKSWFENGIGLVALARKNYDDADRAFRRALAGADAGQEKILKNLKNAPMDDEQRARVLVATEQQFATERAEYLINLGDANYYNGIPYSAITNYEQALEIDSASTEVYYHWAEACLGMRPPDYTCALEKLAVVLRKDSTHAEAWNRAGGIYFKAARSSRSREERKGRFFDAIGAYRKYLELTSAQPDSANVRPFFETAMAYANVSAYDSSSVYFDKVLAIPYEPREIYYHYGKSLWGVRDYEKSGTMLLKHLDWIANQGEDYTSRIGMDDFYKYLGDAYFYRKPKDYFNAIKYYKESLAIDPNQKRLLQNVAVGYHTTKSYGQAIEYYDLRIALGIDSNAIGIFKNAGLCALNIASNSGEGDEEELLDDEMEEELGGGGMPGVDENLDYYEVAIGYMNKYLEVSPNDTTVILRVANTYLYQLLDCANGVAAFERLLTLTPDNCSAMKSIGFAYFGESLCNRNYSKALPYFLRAYECTVGSGGACDDISLVKYIAQCYHLRAAGKTEGASDDYRKAHEWYGKLLKCDPGDVEAKKARDDISFEFN